MEKSRKRKFWKEVKKMPDVAHVIVDVPSMQTDIPYTYLIPEELSAVIERGMRVEVPFGGGNRHVQGFVVDTFFQTEEEIAQADFELKPITSVLDLVPVLNDELLELADELQQTTFAFKITCLQAMLPSVMRSSYQKWIRQIDEIPEEIGEQVFGGLSEVTWEHALSQTTFNQLMKWRQQEQIEVFYEVKTKNKVKTVRCFSPALDFEALEEARMSLRKTAKQKNRLISFLQTLEPDAQITVKEAKTEFGFSPALLKEASELGWLTFSEREVYRDPYADKVIAPSTSLQMTNEQQIAYEQITEAIKEEKPTTFLLEGVTGSGKTEVYLQTIDYALQKGKTAIMLVPEISLTPQTVHRFKSRFGDQVAVLHSGLSQGEKYDEWRKIERKEAKVVVGARSAIFAPLENIGLIIMDEEHESSYKQEETPRYQARDLAIWRANYHHCPVILGSATPSLESRARAQKGVYQLLRLTQRANQAASLPHVEIVDMRKELQAKSSSSFSRLLLTQMEERLKKDEQIVLMLNRRGYSSFVMCRDCGYVLPCPNCDISLTLHMDNKKMKCHYCGHEEPIPHECPVCGSDKIRYYGTGTQKVEEELQKLFPEEKIIRMDVDTTRKKGAHEKLLAQFGQKEARILLGTQMIAKGLDFPDVTLVGVLNADTSLNLPDFRSSERTFQLLTQVSGRAGRAEKAGEVVIQTFNPDHYAIVLAQAQDYEGFYQREMYVRHQGDYPPYYYTIQVAVSHPEEVEAARKIYYISEELKTILSPQSILLGPTPKSVLRVNNRYYYQLIIKYKHEPLLRKKLKEIAESSQSDERKNLRISIDVEPNHFI